MGGPDEGNQRTAFAHQRDFFCRRAAYLENDVSASPELGGVGDNVCAGCAIGLVIEIRCFARARLNRNLESKLDQLFDDIGNSRNPFFAGKNFARHANSQWHLKLHVMKTEVFWIVGRVLAGGFL